MNKNITRLSEIIALLRAPGGCPWDREQTHESLIPCLIEECYEIVDAIALKDDENFKEELGDLLIVIMLQSQLAKEREAFDFQKILDESCEKLIRRHPHVFKKDDLLQKNPLLTSNEALQQWDVIKKGEQSSTSKKRNSTLDGVPSSFPALLKAEKIQKKAAKVGFDWKIKEDVFEKIEEELSEVKEAITSGDRTQQEEELGDLLFSIVNLTRFMNMNAELLLQQAIKKFTRRFHAMELLLQEQGRSVEQNSLVEWDKLWEQVKSSDKEHLKT